MGDSFTNRTPFWPTHFWFGWNFFYGFYIEKKYTCSRFFFVDRGDWKFEIFV